MSLKRNILDLRKRKEIVLQGGGEDAIKKQAAMGKLTARERIESILDKGSFHEYDMFVEHQSKDFDMDKKVLHGDGVVIGTGTVYGEPVAIYAQDFTVAGGSLGLMHARKITKIMDHAIKMRMPIIGEGDAAQSVNQMLSAVLQSVTFGTDGNVIASYSDAADVASPSWQNSPAGMVQYCVKNGQLLVYLDIDKIMALASGGTSTLADGDSSGDLLTLLLPTLLSHIGEIAPMLSQGIPLDYGFDDNGMLTVSMGQDGLGGVVLGILKELMNNEAVLAALVEQAKNNPTFASYADALTQIPDVLNATTNFAIGLNFNPASAE